MDTTGIRFYPATIGELRELLADLPEDSCVSSYDDYCLEVQVFEDGVVFDHGCSVNRGYGPWDEEEEW